VVHYLHTEKIIHRDLRPANILIPHKINNLKIKFKKKTELRKFLVIVFSVIHLKYFYSDTKYIGLKLEENIK
jgi:serine/threonine protein kinase